MAGVAGWIDGGSQDLAQLLRQREEELRRAAEESRARAQIHRQQAQAAQADRSTYSSPSRAVYDALPPSPGCLLCEEDLGQIASSPAALRPAKEVRRRASPRRKEGTPTPRKKSTQAPRTSPAKAKGAKSGVTPPRDVKIPRRSSDRPAVPAAAKLRREQPQGQQQQQQHAQSGSTFTQQLPPHSSTIHVHIPPPPVPTPAQPLPPPPPPPPPQQPSDEPKDSLVHRLQKLEHLNASLQDKLDQLTAKDGDGDSRMRRLEEDNTALREQIGMLLQSHPLLQPKEKRRGHDSFPISTPPPPPPPPAPAPAIDSSPLTFASPFQVKAVSPPSRVSYPSPDTCQTFSPAPYPPSVVATPSHWHAVPPTEPPTRQTAIFTPPSHDDLVSRQSSDLGQTNRTTPHTEKTTTQPAVLLTAALEALVDAEGASRMIIEELAAWGLKGTISAAKGTTLYLRQLEGEALLAHDQMEALEAKVAEASKRQQLVQRKPSTKKERRQQQQQQHHHHHHHQHHHYHHPRHHPHHYQHSPTTPPVHYDPSAFPSPPAPPPHLPTTSDPGHLWQGMSLSPPMSSPPPGSPPGVTSPATTGRSREEEKQLLLERMKQAEAEELEAEARNAQLRAELEAVQSKLRLQSPLPFAGLDPVEVQELQKK